MGFRKQKRAIAWKLVLSALLFSAAITLVITVIQLTMDYNTGLKHIDNQILSIETGYRASLEHGIWIDDKELLNLQMIGILNLPDIKYIKLDIVGSDPVTMGQKLSQRFITETIKLNFQQDDRQLYIGTATIMADLDGLYQQLFDKVFVILLSQSVKTFLTSFFILFLVQYLLIRHLETIATFSRAVDLDKEMSPLALEKTHSDDELDEVVAAFNLMQKTIQEKITSLAEVNAQLDSRVISRTKKLQKNIKELKLAQSQLIQSEKMAALGGLVAGVAHEINTPVGVGITSITYLQELTHQLKKHHETEQMTQTEFEDYLVTSSTALESIYINLKRTAELVKSFKQVTADQSIQGLQTFLLAPRLQQIVFSLSNPLKHSHIKVDISCDEELVITTDPGALAQIFINFIMNSLTHGFEKNDVGSIRISAFKNNNKIHLIYTDSGKGITPRVLPKIFDPFFTTNRAAGGTGLGLNIVYNIVVSQLSGTITAASKIGEGVEFKIELPEQQPVKA